MKGGWQKVVFEDLTPFAILNQTRYGEQYERDRS